MSVLKPARSQLETWDSPAAGCAAGHGGRHIASRSHMHSHDEERKQIPAPASFLEEEEGTPASPTEFRQNLEE